MNENTKVVEQSVRAGFTLIEIIIAVAIVGIMAAVAVPAVNAHISNAQKTACRQLISTVSASVTTYAARPGTKLPASNEEWVKALTEGDEPLIEGGEDALNDPWGNPLQFERIGKTKRIKITSAGPDGEMGNEDDITNIEKKN